MSLVEFVGRKRGRLFVALSFFSSFFNAHLVVCLSMLAAPSMGMMGKSELKGWRRGGRRGVLIRAEEFRLRHEIKPDYFS